MPMLSSLPQRFHADPGHASLQTLRWQDRPVPWPRGPSRASDPWGHAPDRPGGTRSGCHGGQRTGNDLPHTLRHQRKRSVPPGILVPCRWCLAGAARRSAREVGRPLRPSSRWGGWLRHAARS